jgi:polysaccharide export outer membrane protein
MTIARLLFVSLAFHATLAAAPQQTAPSSEINGANLPALPVGPEDLIAVSVYGSPELSRTLRVSEDGHIRLPMLREPIKVIGLMPSAIEAVIAQALVSEQVLVDPAVTVIIVEYRSHPISVAGAVRKPVTFQAYGNVTVLDALARAEGLAPDAGPEILVSRLHKDDDGRVRTLVQRIPVRGLIDAADPELNLKLEGGEEIRVPEAGKVFVLGNVKKPGAFPVNDASDTTVLKMLALSEGLMSFTSKVAYIYRREGGTGGKKNEIEIPLQKIVHRKAPDVTLQANDILYIPDDSGRRATATVLDRIAGFGSATASGVLIYKH